MINKIRILKRYKKVYKNYFIILSKLYFKRREILQNDNIMMKVILRDGREINVPSGWVMKFAGLHTYQNENISNLSLAREGISFRYKDFPVIINPARSSDLEAVFFKEEYNFLNVKDRDVIDIGMNIGDSTIYFALNGARRVIGLEPYAYAFSYAEKNVKLNNLQNVIILNAGYGKDSKIIVGNYITSSPGSSLIASNDGKEIQIYSLKTLLNKYEIENAVLKMDCEGCEYNLLEEDCEVLRRFNLIQIEYHYGYEKLKEKLEKCGFNVKYTEPENNYNLDATDIEKILNNIMNYAPVNDNPDATNPKMVVGYIYAKRK